MQLIYWLGKRREKEKVLGMNKERDM